MQMNTEGVTESARGSAGTNTNQPSFVRNVFFHFAQQFAPLVIGMISSIIIARWLGPGGKGIVNTLGTFTGFVATIAFLGLPTAVVYYSASRTFSYKEIAGNFIFFLLIFSLPLSFISLSIAPFLKSNILKDIPLPLIIVALLLIPLKGFQALLDSFLMALQRFPQLFFQGVGISFLNVALLALFLIVLKLGVLGAMLATWLLIPTSIAILLYFLKDILKREYFKPVFQKDLLKSLLSYGIKCFLSNILWLVNLRFDVFVVNYFLAPSAVGLYMTGVAYTELLRMFPSAVSGVLFPRVSISSGEEASKFTAIIVSILTLFLIPAAILSYLFAPIIIPFLFGKAFIPSVSVVGYLLPGVITWALGSQLGSYLLGKGFPEAGIWASLGGVIATIALDFTLIPVWGIKGASIASSTAYTVVFCIRLYYFHSLARELPIWRIFLPTRQDIKILVGAIKARLRAFQK